MTYTITYRDAQGAKTSLELNAADKAAVFAELRRRGISPITIAEGKSAAPSRPRRAPTATKPASPRTPPSWRRGALAGLAVIIIVLAITYSFLGRSRRAHERPAATPTASSAAVERTSAATTARPADANAEGDDTEAAARPKRELKPTDVVKVEKAQTNSNGVVEEVVVKANGERVRRVYNPRPVLFTNPSDQAIMTTFSFQPGAEIPPTPMPADLDEAFERSLAEPIEINDDDPADVRAQKLLVREMREEIAKRRESGMSVADILHQHIKINNENAQIRSSAMAELREILREGDEEGAEKFITTMNVGFQQLGIPELEMPLTPAERRALRESGEE